MTIITRDATTNDLDNVLLIDNLADINMPRANLILESIKSGKCIVANESNTMVGYVIYGKNFFMQNFISLLVVSPEKRRKGIAQKLLTAVENRCSGKLFTSCNKSNHAAHQLFLKTYFVESGIIYNLDLNDPEIIFFKQLKQPRA